MADRLTLSDQPNNLNNANIRNLLIQTGSNYMTSNNKTHHHQTVPGTGRADLEAATQHKNPTGLNCVSTDTEHQMSSLVFTEKGDDRTKTTDQINLVLNHTISQKTHAGYTVTKPKLTNTESKNHKQEIMADRLTLSDQPNNLNNANIRNLLIQTGSNYMTSNNKTHHHQTVPG
eukprot:CAMPEP_0197233712 /NCGR_PEP_ID=MMETSP1429-20130617/1708_1 /TAXON_ID=49237 /ORGANISM="Chaetoceros  sp., Strain UNC1202" /LENGTH=173 /DNA_ID=CAMNT_0042692017 /DNA_START=26 /DNA_END=544 /DNA_ORIENTATION=-